MEQIKYIFVILVYRNTVDLVECLDSICAKVSSYKTVVVNAYYDKSSQKEIERISSQYKCDFINIENKGYSYGNNIGIEFAIKNYSFEYVIVSNPDILIERFDDSLLTSEFKYDIIAPKITTVTGKAQNPAAVRRLPLSEYLVYKGYKTNSKLLLLCGLTISKLYREFILNVKKIGHKRVYAIYCAHGSFLMLSKKLVETLKPVYDNNMFLFGEEGVLAFKAKRANLKTCYMDYISIRHKEDGSMKMSEISMDGEMKKSNIYYYEKYVK